MKKLFTMAYSIKQEVCYGIVSNAGKTSLVLGVNPNSNDETIKVIIEGLLPGVKIEKYTDRFSNAKINEITIIATIIAQIITTFLFFFICFSPNIFFVHITYIRIILNSNKNINICLNSLPK